MNNKNVWDKVYRDRTPENLPWYGIPFFDHVGAFLKTLDKSELLIVPCCGVGDTADKLYKEGFTNIVATDVSSEAIAIAKKRFPHISFKCIGTEKLADEGYKGANVLDWLNLHQMKPELLPLYLKSLNKISKSLFLAYFYDPKMPYSRKSMVTGDLVYNYEPNLVTDGLDMNKIKEFVFYVAPRKVEGRLGDELRVVAQIYKK